MLMRSELHGDPDEIKIFLATLFKHCAPNQGFLALRAFTHETNKPVIQEWRKFDSELPARVAELSTIVAQFMQAERSVFCPPVCLFNSPTKAVEDNVLCAPALTVEVDSAPQASLETLRAILGEPTCIVASGGTWQDASGGSQDKLHLHWRLERPAIGPDLPMLKQARRFAAAIVGADMTNVPVVHPLRWPGSWHTKGEPRLCRIVGGEPDRDVNLYDAYSALSELAERMGVGSVSEAGDTEGFKTDDPWTADALDAAAATIDNADNDWHAWNKIGMAFYDASHGSPDGLSAFHTVSAKHGEYDPGTTDARWENYHKHPPTKTSAGTLIYEARKVDPDFHKRVGDPSIYFEDSPPSSENSSKSLSNTGSKPVKKVFSFVGFNEAATRAISAQGKPLIKGLLDQGAMTILYGPSNVGKTFVTMDLAFHVAVGLPYGGMRTSGGAVVYVAAEGGRGVYQRVAALKAKYQADDAPFHVLPASVDLRRKDADLTPLIAAVRALSVPVALIVVDTLSRAMAGGDENSSVDMGNIVAHFDVLRHETDAHLLVVHHTGKTIANGARGHSLLRAATDTEIEISEGMFEVTKQRDLPKSWSSAFSLDVVELGKDADGDPITSCTVRLVAKGEGFAGDMNTKEAAVYRAISELEAFSEGSGEGVALHDIEDFLARTADKLSRDIVRHSLRGLAAKRAIHKVARGKWAQNRQSVCGETVVSQFVETSCNGETSPNDPPNSFE